MVLTDVISSIGEAGLAAVTGYLVVFFGIALLMAVMAIMGKVMQSAQKKAGAGFGVRSRSCAGTELPRSAGLCR